MVFVDSFSSGAARRGSSLGRNSCGVISGVGAADGGLRMMCVVGGDEGDSSIDGWGARRSALVCRREEASGHAAVVEKGTVGGREGRALRRAEVAVVSGFMAACVELGGADDNSGGLARQSESALVTPLPAALPFG